MQINKHNILLLDYNNELGHTAAQILGNYNLTVTNTQTQLINKQNKIQAPVIVLNENNSDTYTLCNKIKSNNQNNNTFVIIIINTNKTINKVINSKASDFITKAQLKQVLAYKINAAINLNIQLHSNYSESANKKLKIVAENIDSAIRYDASQRLNTEQKLKVSEEKYRLITDNISDLVWKTDLNLNFTYISPSVFKIRGYTVNEAYNQHINDKFTHKSLIHINRILRKKLDQIASKNPKAWEPVVGDFQLYKKDGSTIWMQISTQLMKDTNGNPCEIVGVARDISKQKKFELSLIDTTKKLEQKNQEKDLFISILGHDLIDSVGGNLNIVELLKKKGAKWEKHELFLDHLHNNTQSSLNILTNLIAWGKASVCAKTLNPIKLHVSELIDNTKIIFKQKITSKNIDFINNISFNDIIFADAYMLKTILRNLISNALKFTNPDGYISIDLTSDSNNYKFCIQDNGIGMSKELVNTIFIDNTIKSTNGTQGEKGNGIGIQIIKRYIAFHKGQIWAESEIGLGTKIFFTLPII